MDQVAIGTLLDFVTIDGVLGKLGRICLEPLMASDVEEEKLMGGDDGGASSDGGADIIWAAAIIDYSLPHHLTYMHPHYTTTVLYCCVQ